MSLTAAAIRLLAEKGLSAHEIADIAEAQAPVRSSAAERQARYRERKKAEAESDVTGDVTNVTEGAKESPPTPPKENILPPVSPKGDTAPQGAKRKRGSRIPEDWLPPPVNELPEAARSLARQWTAASYRAEAEAFVNYWLGETGAKATKACWNRAWFNRITQIHSKVMRDQKFGNAAPDIPKTGAIPADKAAQLDMRARAYRLQGRDNEAEEFEREAARLRAA